MKRLLSHWRGLMLSLVVFAAFATLSSCGNDEPDNSVIDYYLRIEEEFLVDGSTSHTDRYFNPVTRMKSAISAAYPEPDTQGNDEAVVAACDKEFETYQSLYAGGKEHLTCLFELVRVTKVNDIVRSNETLKVYQYNINPPAIED